MRYRLALASEVPRLIELYLFVQRLNDKIDVLQPRTRSEAIPWKYAGFDRGTTSDMLRTLYINVRHARHMSLKAIRLLLRARHKTWTRIHYLSECDRRLPFASLGAPSGLSVHLSNRLRAVRLRSELTSTSLDIIAGLMAYEVRNDSRRKFHNYVSTAGF